MTIRRQFQPDFAAMDELVAVLYELLIDTAAEKKDQPAQPAPESTCLSSRPE
jgi:hypothetical protein